MRTHRKTRTEARVRAARPNWPVAFSGLVMVALGLYIILQSNI